MSCQVRSGLASSLTTITPPTMANMAISEDAKSHFRLRFGIFSGAKMRVPVSAIAATGTLMRKTECQE